MREMGMWSAERLRVRTERSVARGKRPCHQRRGANRDRGHRRSGKITHFFFFYPLRRARNAGNWRSINFVFLRLPVRSLIIPTSSMLLPTIDALRKEHVSLAQFFIVCQPHTQPAAASCSYWTLTPSCPPAATTTARGPIPILDSGFSQEPSQPL